VTLTTAHEAWRAGRLVAAEAAYRDAANAQPDLWTASFQLAWLDAAFGRLSPARARAFHRQAPGAAAQRRVDVLVALCEGSDHLDGSLRDWDIEALRSAGAREPDDWWLERARRAWRAGLYGLADACVDEAVERSVVLADDKPHWAVGLLTQADEHLAAIG
jgi:hypothetical protein